VAGILTSRFGRDCLVEVRRLRDRGLGVVGKVGVDLDRDVAVSGFRPLPDRSEQVAGRGDVAHRQREEVALGVATRGGDLLIVGIAAGEGLGEDRRVRGDAGDGVFAHHARELAAAEKVAREEVDPDALAVVCEPVERCADRHV
jgi:hypothetical protein